jgi:hypothetical protein
MLSDKAKKRSGYEISCENGFGNVCGYFNYTKNLNYALYLYQGISPKFIRVHS